MLPTTITLNLMFPPACYPKSCVEVPAPTITGVSPSPFGPSTALQVDFSYAGHKNHVLLEVYEDANLTVLNQTIDAIMLDASSSISPGTAPPALSPNTPYWIRMKLSNDGGATYTAWSNTATGSTSP